MKVFISGICGFVGTTLALEWRKHQPDLTIFGGDNLSRPGSELNRARLQDAGVHVVHLDIRSQSDFETLPAVDYVVDAAANPSVLAGIDGKSSSRQVTEHNLFGTVNLLEYCKAHKAGFILLSTSRVYAIEPLASLELDASLDAFSPKAPFPRGVSQAGISEAFSTAAPVSLYGATKIASEVLALEYGSTFDFPVWINRCGVMAGAGQFGHAEQGIFSFWIHRWNAKQPLRYIGFEGCGKQVRDCFHPRDLISLLRKQIEWAGSSELPRTVNLSGGLTHSMSLKQLSAWCADRFGPHEVSPTTGSRAFDLPWVVLDSALATEKFDWQPTLGMQEILEEIAQHAEANPHWLKISQPYTLP